MSWQDLEAARVVVGRPGLIAGEGITAAEKLDILSRLAAVEALTTPPASAITGGRQYGPLTTLSGYGPTEAFTVESMRLYVSAFYNPQDAGFDEIALNVTTGGSSAFASIRFGVYSVLPNGLPWDLVADLGVVVIGTSTGLKARTIDLVLPRGLYWLAFASTGTIAVDAKNPNTSSGMTSILGHLNTSGDTPRAAGYRTDLLANLDSLPNPLGGLGTHAPVPMLWLRAA